MQRLTTVLALSALVAGAMAETPVQKVIGLMEGMLEKGTKDMQAEQVQFAVFKTFCEDTATDKADAIQEANEQIELLKADIEKYTEDAARLTEEINSHDADISAWEGDENAATNVRKIEKADFDAMNKDYSESVDALTRAVAVLKKQSHDRTQKASLTQVSAVAELEIIPKEAKRAIELFLQQGPDEGLDVAAPEANGYEFQSSHIVEMLEKLQDKFMTERDELRKKETESVQSYEMLMQDLKNMLANADKDHAFKSGAKAKALQGKADSEGSLVDTTGTRDADTTYVTDLKATCETKATDFDTRQKLRGEEIEAIKKAIEIISSGAVSGAADKQLPTLLQAKAKATSLAQLRSEKNLSPQEKAAHFIQKKASQLNSRVLTALVAHLASDPFNKIKKMIKDLITRLMEEANEETEHKGWCDTELSTNRQTREEKTTLVEGLTAEIDELKASISHLTEDVAELTTQVAELDKAMAEMTSIRQAEKAKNTETIADAEAAQTAVEQALVVLKEFYAKAAESTALLQRKGTRQQPEAPEIFDKPYTGMGGDSGGVVGMLEVINSDFARLEADTVAAEAAGKSEYDAFMHDSQIDKAEKSKDIEHKTKKKQEQSSTLTETTANLAGTQKELTAAIAYYDKLKPSCVDSGVTYEDTVARRKEEIESLQQALRILNGEDMA